MQPKKSLGQNFLVDGHYLSLIADECIKDAGNLLEIGCGTGLLTKTILSKLPSDFTLHGIELDQRAIVYLNQISLLWPNFSFENLDATRLDYKKLALEKTAVVGNLPYNAGTKILLDCAEARVNKMVFLLQKEVVDRVNAKVGSADYSGISVLVQAFYKVKGKLTVPPNCFSPPPKVYSKLLVCELLPDKAINYNALSKLVRAAFCNRRKMLRNNLGSTYPQLLTLVDQTLRPQDLTVEEYCNLSKHIT
jgi:16S rRNA (adenine1518-N6/adenine1519-N6)-dimethyltransferase